MESKKVVKTNTMFLMSYLPFKQIDDVLTTKSSQLVSYAFILHDKDVYLKDVVDKDGVIKHKKGDKEINHTHIYLRFKYSRSIDEICRWFEGIDEKGLEVNTFAEKVLACQSAIDYLTHKNQPEKYQYDVSEVHYGGANIKEDDNGNLISLDSTLDESYDVVECLLSGMPLKQVVRIFGKDFVYHYASYKELRKDIIEEEGLIQDYDRLWQENKKLEMENEHLKRDLIMKTDNKFFTQCDIEDKDKK